jgi:hypothetical protein
MIPYRKFSDVLKDEGRKTTPSKPPKAPKVAPEASLKVHALGGLGALGAHDPAGEFCGPLCNAQDERAAINEFDGSASRQWAGRLARLDQNNPPGDVPPRRWLRLMHDCGRFLDGEWAARAVALSWGPLDLFGCDPEKPFARVSRQGLLWLLDGRPLLALTGDTAAIANSTGGRFTYYRRPPEPGQVLVWELTS